MKEIGCAPKDGSTIVGVYCYGNECTDRSLIFWSDRPVCMGGHRVGGRPPGWAVAIEEDCDTNLPVDAPDYWEPYE